MAERLTSILPLPGPQGNSVSDARGPTLMSLPYEMMEHILLFLLPDKDILGVTARHWISEMPEEGRAKPDDATYRASGDLSIWHYNDEFRNDKEPVRTAILRVNRYLYEVGSRVLYGRTVEVSMLAKKTVYEQWQYDPRSSYISPRDFPWAKMRKIVISIRAVFFLEYLEQIRDQLLVFCASLAFNGSVIHKLHVVYTGEWDPAKTIIPPEERYSDTLPSSFWTISGVEAVRMMLAPLRQLTQVQECEIQVPSWTHKIDPSLADEVQRCIRGIKSEEPFAEAELREDREKYVFLRSNLIGMEEETRDIQRLGEEVEAQYDREHPDSPLLRHVEVSRAHTQVSDHGDAPLY